MKPRLFVYSSIQRGGFTVYLFTSETTQNQLQVNDCPVCECCSRSFSLLLETEEMWWSRCGALSFGCLLFYRINVQIDSGDNIELI